MSKKERYYQIQLEGSGMKLIFGKWDLADQLDALLDGNEELVYTIKAIKLTAKEFEKLGEFEGF